MLARYQIVRGRSIDQLPSALRDGIRQDTRKHTRHVLRPPAEAVTTVLANPSPAAFERFAQTYRATLETRFRERRDAFDQLAALARERDVFLGCNCPTTANPDVRHCHTVLALRFLRERYPDLEVVLPDEP